MAPEFIDICETDAALLLPWHVTGRLSPSDSERIQSHLAGCARCRAQLEEERRLHGLLRQDGPVEYAPQGGLARLMARIDESENGEVSSGSAQAVPDPIRSKTGAPSQARGRLIRWLAAAVIVQALGLGLMSALWLRSPRNHAPPAVYGTLTAPAVTVPGGQVRAVFIPSVTLAELRSLLDRDDLIIVSGPSEAGVFTLGSRSDALGRVKLDSVLAHLRANSRVLFAEPVTATVVVPP